MEIFDRDKWIEEDCVPTGCTCCDACPYVVYDEYGTRKCDKEMFEQCRNGEL